MARHEPATCRKTLARDKRFTHAQFTTHVVSLRWVRFAIAIRHHHPVDAPHKMLRASLELLTNDNIHCAVLNKYAGNQARTFLESIVSSKRLETLPFATYINASRIPPSPQTRAGLLYYYTLDAASLIPVCSLAVREDSCVLDLCAAPGGKSFMILQQLSSNGGLALNEPSPARMRRLKSVIRKCLPKELLHLVRFTRSRELLGQAEPNTYDRVLVDAPCSAERHSVRKESDNAGDLYKHSLRFAALQEKLLESGISAASSGAKIVYSTCTLSDKENDEVMSRVLQGSPGAGKTSAVDVFAVKTPLLAELEEYCHQVQTTHGLLVTPTDQKNTGPMYVTVLQKK